MKFSMPELPTVMIVLAIAGLLTWLVTTGLVIGALAKYVFGG